MIFRVKIHQLLILFTDMIFVVTLGMNKLFKYGSRLLITIGREVLLSISRVCYSTISRKYVMNLAYLTILS